MCVCVRACVRALVVHEFRELGESDYEQSKRLGKVEAAV